MSFLNDSIICSVVALRRGSSLCSVVCECLRIKHEADSLLPSFNEPKLNFYNSLTQSSSVLVSEILSLCTVKWPR